MCLQKKLKLKFLFVDSAELNVNRECVFMKNQRRLETVTFSTRIKADYNTREPPMSILCFPQENFTASSIKTPIFITRKTDK